eukprot:jgi/Phyca11/531934/estExt2_fgenesh1_pg.C_PHYCAscaffold_30081
MSQARTFTKKEIDRFRHATEFFLTTLEEKERALYMKDNERRVSSDEPLLREFLVAFSAQVAVQEENLAAQLPAPPEALAEADSSSAKGLRAIRKALPATAATISQAKQTITEISKADVDAASPVASCFYLWVLAAIARAENLTSMADQAQQVEDEAAAAETAGDA